MYNKHLLKMLLTWILKTINGMSMCIQVFLLYIAAMFTPWSMIKHILQDLSPVLYSFSHFWNVTIKQYVLGFLPDSGLPFSKF